MEGRSERKIKENKKKETGSGSPTLLTWPIQSFPMTRRDHTVNLLFLPPPGPQGVGVKLRKSKWKVFSGEKRFVKMMVELNNEEIEEVECL